MLQSQICLHKTDRRDEVMENGDFVRTMIAYKLNTPNWATG